MTSNIDAASCIPVCDPADRAKWSPLPWLLIALVFVVAIGLRLVVPLNADVAWLLTVGERVLDGQRLYSDIVEINPPMAVLAYLPGIASARALDLDPKYAIDAQILLLAAASMLATARILQLSSALDPVKWVPLGIWAAAVLTIKKNVTSIGTINISTGGVVTFTFSAAVSFAAGDKLSVVTPSPQDTTLADVSITFMGSRV